MRDWQGPRLRNTSLASLGEIVDSGIETRSLGGGDETHPVGVGEPVDTSRRSAALHANVLDRYDGRLGQKDGERRLDLACCRTTTAA